jgi:hypothetical protein
MNYSRETVEGFLKKSLPFSKTFVNNGETFSAHSEAVAYLKKHGYDVGSMERGSPIGIAKDAIISKWRNLYPEDKEFLDGVLVSESFRESNVTVYLNINPEEV